MLIYYYTLFTVFAIICYMMIVDKNVSLFLELVYKITKLNVERFYWMAILHPKNPITNYLKEKEYKKIAESLHNELIANKVED